MSSKSMPAAFTCSMVRWASATSLSTVRAAVRVVARGVDGRVGHGVDRVRADQLVDVERVGVLGVLRRRRRPQRTLHVGALGRQRVPALAAEDAPELLVGDPRVGDGGLALELGRAALLVERGVDLAVDARDEEARDGRDPVDRLAGVGAALQAADVGLRDLHVALHVEQERHVHGDARGGQLLERLDALGGAGHLDEDVVLADLPVEALGRLDGARGVERQLGRQLEGHVAVLPLGLLVHAAQDVGSVADVLERQAEEDLARIVRVLERALEALVVALGVPHGLLEDRGVGSDAADAIVLDETLQDPILEQPAVDVVDPDGLAERLDLSQPVRHVVVGPLWGSLGA